MRPMIRRILPVILALFVASVQAQDGAPPVKYRTQVLSVHDHDPGAFTQGLLLHKGKLYESTGLEGKSSLRRVDQESGLVEKKVDLDPKMFGEGLAIHGDKLIQITWKNGKAFVYNVDTLEKVGEFTYEGEGWGLADDGKQLFMSDGSDKITFRNPDTFEKTGQISVTFQGKPVTNINELEYVNGALYANIWMQDVIVKIDPKSGKVTGVIDAAGLLAPEEKSQQAVLNGIAYDPASGNFLITGKLWPRLFEVQWLIAETKPAP
ncbi:glutaminyl-peptide cyclotransferase [soil metagenome]